MLSPVRPLPGLDSGGLQWASAQCQQARSPPVQRSRRWAFAYVDRATPLVTFITGTSPQRITGRCTPSGPPQSV